MTPELTEDETRQSEGCWVALPEACAALRARGVSGPRYGARVPTRQPAAFQPVRPGTFWASVWTHTSASMRMHGHAKGRVGNAVRWVGAVGTLVGQSLTLLRAMALGWAWQADAGCVVLIAGRRDTLRRWAVDGALIAVAAAMTWWIAPRTTTWGLVVTIAGWLGLVVVGPWLRRRYPRTTWFVSGISSRSRGPGALSRAATHIEALGLPGDRVATRAASERHRAIYRRFGFESLPGDPKTMVAVIPARTPVPGPSGQLRSQP